MLLSVRRKPPGILMLYQARVAMHDCIFHDIKPKIGDNTIIDVTKMPGIFGWLQNAINTISKNTDTRYIPTTCLTYAILIV